MARGIDAEIGSLKERLILNSIREENLIEYLKITAQANATMAAANLVASVLSEGGGSGGNDGLKNVLNYLKGMLLPEYKEDTEMKAEKAKALLEEEQEKTYNVRKLSNSTASQRGRVRLRRKDG